MSTYCNYKSGRQTVGCQCAHASKAIIAIKYLKKGQNIPKFYEVAKNLFINIIDCSTY